MGHLLSTLLGRGKDSKIFIQLGEYHHAPSSTRVNSVIPPENTRKPNNIWFFQGV